MTPEERKALREKHRNRLWDSESDTWQCDDCVGLWNSGPCDVIKVLDAWERREEMEIGLALSNLKEVFKTYPLIGIGRAIYALEGRLF